MLLTLAGSSSTPMVIMLPVGMPSCVNVAVSPAYVALVHRSSDFGGPVKQTAPRASPAVVTVTVTAVAMVGMPEPTASQYSCGVPWDVRSAPLTS